MKRKIPLTDNEFATLLFCTNGKRRIKAKDMYAEFMGNELYMYDKDDILEFYKI